MLYLFGQIQFKGAPEDPAVTFGETESRRSWGLPDTEETPSPT